MELVNIFVLIVGMLSLITNGVLLYILIRDPLKCFKASTTYFIMSLSVSDLLTGTNACFFAVGEFLHLTYEQSTYLLSLFWITTQASFLTLLAMSVERFLIVKYPIYCRVWITKKRVLLAIAFIWSVSATLGGLILLPPPHLDYVQFSIFCEFFLSLFLITGLYSFILYAIKSSKKTVQGTGQLHKGSAQAARQSSLRKSSSGKKDAANVGIQITVTGEPNSIVSKTLVPVGDKSSMISTGHSTTNGKTNNGLGGDLLNGNKHAVGQCSQGIRSSEGDNAKDVITRKKNVDYEQGSVSRKSRRDFIRAAQYVARLKRKTTSSQQDKLTAVVSLLVGILALTVLPYLLASQILLGYSIFCKCFPPEILLTFHYYYFPIELLNFAVNPLVYAWRLPQYRRSLRYLCSRYQANTEASAAGWASFRSASFRMRRDYNST